MSAGVRRVLLIVAPTESLHAARWIMQVAGAEWEVVVFPASAAERTHPLLDRTLVMRTLATRFRDVMLALKWTEAAGLFDRVRGRMERAFPAMRARRLRRAIRRHRPALVHGFEIQFAGYLLLEALRPFARGAPPWLMTARGSDISLNSRLAAHHHRVRAVLGRCDFFSCDCSRDIELARRLGFSGRAAPSAALLGFELERLLPLRARAPAARRCIVLKGYAGATGRALVGLHAIGQCADRLRDYTVAIFSAAPEVIVAAEVLSLDTGIPVRIVSAGSPHDEILRLHGTARASISLGIADGACNSMLEAMVMGSFPIQSDTACASEWIEHGRNGMIVPPDDPHAVAQALRLALDDDERVDRAAAENWEVARARLDVAVTRRNALDAYRDLNTAR